MTLPSTRALLAAGVIVVAVITAAVLIVMPGYHAGLAGALAMLLTPGVILLGALGARDSRGLPGAVLGVGLGLTVLTLVATLLTALPFGLGPASLGVAMLLVVVVGCLVWLQSRTVVQRTHVRDSPGWVALSLMALAVVIAGVASVVAVHSATPVRAGPLLALYAETSPPGGNPSRIGITTTGLGDLRCSVATKWYGQLGERPAHESLMTEVPIADGATWVSDLPRSADRERDTIEVRIRCYGAEGSTLDRRLKLEPVDA